MKDITEKKRNEEDSEQWWRERCNEQRGTGDCAYRRKVGTIMRCKEEDVKERGNKSRKEGRGKF